MADLTTAGDDLEQPHALKEVTSITTNGTGPVCACGWPKKSCLKLTACERITFNDSRTA